ncbi:MAG TPA: SpoIID/LytB domain-containing protein [Rhodothermales bacterium]
MSLARSLLILAALALPLARFVPVATASSVEQVVRVRLFDRERPASIELLALGGRVAFYVDHGSTPVAVLEDGERVTIQTRAGELYAGFLDGGIHALRLRVEPEGDALVRVARLDERQLQREPAYSGLLRLSLDPGQPDRLFVVNEIDLESYVAAVVDREYGNLDAIEGGKALAVAVRTYTIRSRGKYGADFDHVDHVGSQVYGGVGDIRPLAMQAAQSTAGEVLTYRGELIEAVYFASSGGHTADNDLVWDSGPRPYLRGKPDPYDVNPNRNWQTTLQRTEILGALSKWAGTQVEGFVIEERSRDGRAQTIELLLPGGTRRSVRGTIFRNVLNQAFGATTIRSTNFTAVKRGEAYLFEGVGSGHGVGLPQWGAYGMALRGRSYRDILTYYYTGVHIARIEDVVLDEPVASPDEVLPLDGEDLVVIPEAAVDSLESDADVAAFDPEVEPIAIEPRASDIAVTDVEVSETTEPDPDWNTEEANGWIGSDPDDEPDAGSITGRGRIGW